MASTYTPLGIEKMATGENAGTWGTKTNTNLDIIEQISGGFKVQTLNAAGADVGFIEITSDKGHDSFLLDVPDFLKSVKNFTEANY